MTEYTVQIQREFGAAKGMVFAEYVIGSVSSGEARYAAEQMYHDEYGRWPEEYQAKPVVVSNE